MKSRREGLALCAESSDIEQEIVAVLDLYSGAVADGAHRPPRDLAGGGRHQQPEERGRKRKAEAEAEAESRPVGPGTRLPSPAECEALVTEADQATLVPLAIERVGILDRTLSWRRDDRVAAKNAFLAALAETGTLVGGEMVEKGVIPALVKHLQAPPLGEGDKCEKFYEHEVVKLSAYALDLLAEKVSVVRIADLFPKFFKTLDAIKPEHRQLILDNGALSPLLNLLKRHKAGSSSQLVNGLIRCAAEAIAKLLPGDGYHFASNRIVDCGALPSIVLILKSENADIHTKAVALISFLACSSQKIKKDVLAAGALQPIIRLLSSSCVLSQKEAARLVGLFATANSVCKAIVQRGAVRPLIEMLRSPELQAREVSASALWRLAQNSGAQVVIAHGCGLPALLRLLDSESELLQDVAARALHSLLKNEENVSDFITIGGLRKLQRGEFTG
ncbi:hypothetical protein NL676_029615 [Syzygium grande]|nr:hypothetical protein NL676_029615 [Syzygium grande]